MARTYRKNARYYRKYQGVIYNTYGDRTLKGKARHFAKYDWDRKGGMVTTPCIWDGACYRCVVRVGDSECYPRFRGYDKDAKRRCHKTDRARNAIYHTPEDVWLIPTFDPWDYLT